jgi:predicted 3-demethylubiquinone-9 3-methyltransferase (glyoxalase superfamily)
MPRSVRTFLMFEGSAESAMDLYTSVFSGSEVRGVDRYGPGEGPEGKVKRAELSLAGYELMFFDSPMEHEFTFTPAISLFVECESEAELDNVFTRLSDGGAVLMPPDNYGFSEKFAWINDRFGVSWQLNLHPLPSDQWEL